MANRSVVWVLVVAAFVGTLGVRMEETENADFISADEIPSETVISRISKLNGTLE